MMPGMNTLFISDLHLEANHPEITHLFLEFLQKQAANADALYILGDFFELWIGDDEQTEFHQTIILALRALAQKGIPVYFMHGNRDFLIGKKFIQASGCQLLSDPTIINLYGTPTLLMHGDSLCTHDLTHQRFRAFANHPLAQHLFLMLPLKLRKRIGAKIRQKSRLHGQALKTTNPSIMDVTPSEINHIMQKHNVELLIHGHTHRPCIELFKLGKKSARRIVLSDWHQHGNALICDQEGNHRLINFK